MALSFEQKSKEGCKPVGLLIGLILQGNITVADDDISA